MATSCNNLFFSTTHGRRVIRECVATILMATGLAIWLWCMISRKIHTKKTIAIPLVSLIFILVLVAMVARLFGKASQWLSWRWLRFQESNTYLDLFTASNGVTGPVRQQFEKVKTKDFFRKNTTEAEAMDHSHKQDLIDDCVICLQSYNADEFLLVLPCRHYFHEMCLHEWVLRHHVCPLCKIDLNQKSSENDLQLDV